MGSGKAKTVLELAAEERKFLHDIANPLAVAAGMLEAYRDELTRQGVELTEPMTRKLGKAETALDRIATLLKERRVVLIAAQDSSNSDQS
ncbi:hypothetical protein BH10BDE1_BH10BDE1_35090 [soil metagenome]